MAHWARSGTSPDARETREGRAVERELARRPIASARRVGVEAGPEPTRRLATLRRVPGRIAIAGGADAAVTRAPGARRGGSQGHEN